MDNPPAEAAGVQRQRRWFGITSVQLMGVCAIITFALIVGAAGVMVAVEANTGHGKVLMPCEYEALGYDPELGVKPWSLKSLGCVGMICLQGLFLLRIHAFPLIVNVLLPHHTVGKKEKLANYILEILLCTTGLIVITITGTWDLIFNRPKARVLDVETANSIASAIALNFQLVVCSYVLELSFDRRMRLELQVHHFLAIYLATHGVLAYGTIGANVYMARLSLAFLLFIYTEGPVFVMLFAYQLKFYQWVIYEFLAYYYAITRFFVILLISWAWWDTRESVFEVYDHNSITVYSLFLVSPIGLLALLLTQFTAIVNLFGISRRVRGLREQGQVRARLCKLFMNMAKSNPHGLSLEDWIAKVGNVVDGAALPQGGLAAIFRKMDTKNQGSVEEADFVAFFGPLCMNVSEDSEFLRIALLLAFLDNEEELAEDEVEAIMTELRVGLKPKLSKFGGGRGRRLTVDEYVQKKLADTRKQQRDGVCARPPG